ncbi:PqqD family protein [Nonomuraea sp. NPDC049152]|uniref:PqqD family protein n=1 Tax=Nonomuraea sp. NPDC049152 TaxID=3154350 RepID=UPI003409E080
MRPDLTFLSVVEDGPDDYVVGNGATFVNVPGIAAKVLALLDGTRTVEEVRREVLERHGADVDVAAFVGGLAGVGLLKEADLPPSPWDRVRPGHVRWLFSPVANAVVALTTLCAVAAVVARPRIVSGMSGLVWANSLTFTLAFAAGSWVLVFAHELSHILAARSLGVRAVLSLGTRLQFLVVQTNVTGVWRLPRRARYRAHLAGMRTDLFLLAAGACALYVTENAMARLVMVICASQIVWQFMFFMRTDVYYAFANATGNKNLMADAQTYLRRRGEEARRGVRVYAWFLVGGRVLGLAFLLGYTVPITVAVCGQAVAELGTSVQPLLTLAIVAFGWGLYVWVFIRQRLR